MSRASDDENYKTLMEELLTPSSSIFTHHASLSSMVGRDNYLLHSYAVAWYMCVKAESRGLDPELMFLLGLLHDIGREFGNDAHEAVGASLLVKLHSKPNYIYALRYHGMPPTEIIDKYGEEALTPELLLLLEADMHVNNLGILVSYEDRLTDIRNRYGAESQEYKNSEQIVTYLKVKENNT